MHSDKSLDLNSTMEISGLDLLTTPNARKLFALGKDWIVEVWKDKKRDILKIEVLPKLIGRNTGFIVDVLLCNPCEKVRYFAKIQSPHVETVITHYLLKYTNSGPDEFFTAVLDPALRYGWWWCDEHGVITRNVETWRMASSWTTEEILGWVSSGGILQSFVLTLMTHLGRFGNIPGNRDNWGYVADKNTDNTEVPASERMKLVDFSAGGDSYALNSLENFRMAWTDTVLRCTTPYAYMISPKLRDSCKELIMQESVAAHAQQCPWVHSQDTFVTLLQRVCEDTEAWLCDTINATLPAPVEEKSDPAQVESTQKQPAECGVSGADAVNQLTDLHLGTIQAAASAPADVAPDVKKGSNTVNEPGHGNSSSNIEGNAQLASSSSSASLLQAFRNKPMPNVKHCSGTKATMVHEYIEWVEQWNDEVTEFCKWFPFPAAVDAKTQEHQRKTEQGQDQGQGQDQEQKEDHGKKQEQKQELGVKEETRDDAAEEQERVEQEKN